MTTLPSIGKTSELIDELNAMSVAGINAGRIEEIAATANRMIEAGQSIEAGNVLGMIAALRGDAPEVKRQFNEALCHGGNDAWTLDNYATALNHLVGVIQKNKYCGQFSVEQAELEQRQSQCVGAAPVHMNDIAERKCIDEAWSTASDRDFRSLVESLPDNVARWDRQGRYVYINPTLECTLAQAKVDVIGQTKSEAFPDGRFALVEKTIAQIVATGETVRLVRQIVPAENGEMRLHDITLVPEFDVEGQVVSVVSLGRDMTDFYRMQEVFAAREQEFRSLAENLPDNIIRWDCQGRYLYINPTHERLLGIPAMEIVGREISDTHESVKAAIAQVVASGQPALCVRQQVIDAQGERVFHEVRLIPERDSTGRVVSVLGIGRDMTDIYRMQDDIVAHEFRCLAESLPDCIARYDRDGRHRYLNATLVNILGLNSAEEVIGKCASEVWPDGRFDQIDRAAALAIENDSAQIIELTALRENGGCDYHQIYIVPERDVAGAIVGTIAFGRNVTSIRETGRRLNHFIDNLPGFAYTIRVAPDGHWSFPYASPSIQDFYGLQPEDVLDNAAPIYALAHPDDQPRIKAAIEDARRMIAPLRFEFRVCRPGVPERWLEVSSGPDLQADGSILWYGIMLDITARKRIEEQLKLKEFALDQAHEAAYLIDVTDLHFIYVNEEACRSLGYSRDELLSLSLPDIDPYLPAEKMRAIEEKLMADSSIILESHHRRRDGSSFPVEVQSSVFEYQGRRLVMSLVRDVTERKRAELALEESRIQLRGLIAQREEAREEERRHIARELHDELGQLMTALRLSAKMLVGKVGDSAPSLRDHLHEIVAVASEAQGVVRNLSKSLRPVELDMGIVRTLEWAVKRFETFTNIGCRRHIAPPEIKPDEFRAITLFRIAQESLTNIAKHAQASAVEISFYEEADDYVLKVRDNGKGFDAGEKKANSFGLVGIRERALMLGGTVSIDSGHENGTEIVVRIPVGEKL